MRLYAAFAKRGHKAEWSSASATREYMAHPRISAPIPHELYQVNHIVTETVTIPAAAEDTTENPSGDATENPTTDITVHSLVPATDAPRDTPLNICIYIHGGGYLNGLSTRHWKFISDLAAAGMKVIVPDYGLAPQYEASSARELLNIIFARASHEAAASGHQVRLAGDSAGAGLALGWLLTGASTGPAPIDRIALLSPWLDVTCSTPGMEALLATDPILHPDSLRTAGESWGRTVGVHNPLVSPLFSTDEQLASLPPLALWTGTRDILHADAVALKQRLEHLDNLNNPRPEGLLLETCPGAIHNYPLSPTPEGEKARREVITWLNH